MNPESTEKTAAPIPPSQEVLEAQVEPSPELPFSITPKPVKSDEISQAAPQNTDDVTKEDGLSFDAKRFLMAAAEPGNEDRGLTALFKALDIKSGSVKERVQKELLGRGFIRIEKRGKSKVAHLYQAGWDYLGIKKPKGSGRGGSIHQRYAKRIKKMFDAEGFDTQIEIEIGANRKRVDLVAYGKEIIGIEIALTDLSQEVHNIKEDLNSNILNRLVVASHNPDFLGRIQKKAMEDPEIQDQASKIYFCLLPEICVETDDE